MDKRLRIVIPIYKFGKAGGNRVLSILANKWIEKGHSVCFVAAHNSDMPYFPTQAKIVWLDDAGSEIIKEHNATRKYSTMKSIMIIKKYLHSNHKNYDIALANFYLTAVAVYLSRINGKIYYIQAYEPEFYSWKNCGEIIQKVISWCTYYFPLKRIVNANIYRKYKNLRSKYVIPPGLDLNVYYPKNRDPRKKGGFVIGCIGRKEEWKGTQDVVESVRILHKQGYDIKFKVAFNSVDYDNYELVEAHGDEKLAQFYRDLDILVAPGHIQLGAVHYPVIEAMACKTPVITTGYYPANTSNSYIVPIKRPDLIAQTIIEIMSNYAQAIYKSEIAYKEIKQFDWELISQIFLDIFETELRRTENDNSKKS